MAISIRTITALAGDDQTFTTVAGDTAIIVGMTVASTTQPTMTFDGVSLTHIVSRASNPNASLFYLNAPAIGAKTLACTNLSSIAQCVVFIQGGTVASVTGSNSNSHASNDIISSGSITSAVGDLAFYMSHKTSSGAAAYQGGETSSSNVATGSRGAHEAGAAGSVEASYGFSGADSSMVVVGCSLLFAPFGGPGIVWIF